MPQTVYIATAEEAELQYAETQIEIHEGTESVEPITVHTFLSYAETQIEIHQGTESF